MDRAGRSSWRFAESARSHLPHVAVFVRDAVGLPVAPGPGVPPPLVGGVPDHHDVLPAEDRQVAGRQWAGWWADVVDLEVQRRAAPDPGRGARAGRERAGAPPDFAALADRPALHHAVVEVFPEAHRWVSRLTPGVPDERHGCFPYRLVRQVAEDVASARSVDVGDVRAAALVLDVDGRWWHLLAPGTVTCSRAAAADPVLAELVLRRAFESGLRPPA